MKNIWLKWTKDFKYLIITIIVTQLARDLCAFLDSHVSLQLYRRGCEWRRVPHTAVIHKCIIICDLSIYLSKYIKCRFVHDGDSRARREGRRQKKKKRKPCRRRRQSWPPCFRRPITKRSAGAIKTSHEIMKNKTRGPPLPTPPTPSPTIILLCSHLLRITWKLPRNQLSLYPFLAFLAATWLDFVRGTCYNKVGR